MAMAAEINEWEGFVERGREYLQLRQDELTRDFDLSKHERYDFDQATGTLVFSNAGKAAVIAEIQFVGSFSENTRTWLWSWANSSVDPQLYAELDSVYEFGEERNFSKLTDPGWSAEEADGWDMAAVTAFLLNARGVYRAPSGNLQVFMVITEISRVYG